MNQEMIFYAAAFLTALLGLVIAAVAYSYRQLIKKFYALKEEGETISKASKEKGAVLVKEAEAESQRLINEAKIHSQKIIQESTLLSEDVKAFQNENYQKMLETIKNEYIKMLSSISKDINAQVSNEITKFLSSLQSEVLRSQEAVMATIQAEYKKVQEDLSAYKLEMEKKVDDSIFKVINTVSRRVIGKNLSIEEQEELVLQALNEAKRQNIF